MSNGNKKSKRGLHLPVLQDTLAEPAQNSNVEVEIGKDLPVLHEAELDWDGLDCALADIDDFADVSEILGRDAQGNALPYQDIVEARNDFVDGILVGLQLTYTFVDEVWLDTLLRSEKGASLVRMLATPGG